MDEYQKYCGTANTIGVPFQVIGPQQVRDLWPLVELGDGAARRKSSARSITPMTATSLRRTSPMALRKGARSRGAEIQEQCEVTAVKRTLRGSGI